MFAATLKTVRFAPATLPALAKPFANAFALYRQRRALAALDADRLTDL